MAVCVAGSNGGTSYMAVCVGGSNGGISYNGSACARCCSDIGFEVGMGLGGLGRGENSTDLGSMMEHTHHQHHGAVAVILTWW